VERDLMGGRIGTRMSAINCACIAAGPAGITTHEIAAKVKETPGLVSAQLSWICAKGGLCTRTVEKDEAGKKVSRWTVTSKKG
jgi:hypothetical protein